jgi:hypothetical protein
MSGMKGLAHRDIRGATSTVLGGAILAIVVAGLGCYGEESPGDKQEWSILQSLEATTRGQMTTKAQSQVVDGYEVVGLPREGDAHIVWVMLKPTHGSAYKQMPDGCFQVDSELWNRLWADHRMSNTVANALRGHLRDPRP